MGYRDYCSGQKDLTSHSRAARAEDIAFMRENGATEEEIATRIGLAVRSLDRLYPKKAAS